MSKRTAKNNEVQPACKQTPTVAMSNHLNKTPQRIEDCILVIRNQQVMLDSDLAILYGVETRVLNQAVKRNSNRFPEHYRFQLTDDEKREVITFCDNPDRIKFGPVPPYVFTERGVAMLSAVLRTPTAVQVSIGIMDAFVAMRHFLTSNSQIFKRIEVIEHHQLLLSENVEVHNQQIAELLQRMDEKAAHPTQGIFYDGQIFDAHTFVCELIRSAKRSIVLVDNYVDDSVLKRLDKRADGVTATIYTRKISAKLQIDLTVHNSQYTPITILTTNKAHDRFLLIDDEVYHLGASIKDLGKKIFAFNKMGESAATLLERLA